MSVDQKTQQRNEARVRRATGWQDVTVLGASYRVQSPPPLEVIGIARRLGAFAKDTLRSAAALEVARARSVLPKDDAADEAADEKTQMEAMANVAEQFSPLLEALARMPEEDQNYIIKSCLLATADPTNKLQPCLWDVDRGLPATGMSAGEVLAATVEVLRIVLPEMWGELQQVLNSLGAAIVSGFSPEGTSG